MLLSHKVLVILGPVLFLLVLTLLDSGEEIQALIPMSGFSDSSHGLVVEGDWLEGASPLD